MAKRLTHLKIREVSSVDKGAGEGVKVVLFKREAMNSVAKIFGECELTIGKDGTITHDRKVFKGLGDSLSDAVKNRVRDSVDVFCKSCREIMASDEANKEALLEKSLGEFAEHVEGLGTEGSTPAIAAVVFEALETKDADMNPKELEALQAKAAEAEALKKETETLKADIAKRDAELSFAKMSDEHKAHASKLSEAERAKFIGLSAAERDAALKKSVEKRDEDPIFKAMNERIAKAETEAAELRKRLDAEEDAKEKIAFGKKATEVYSQPETFGETLRKAYKGDAAAQAEVEKVTLSLKRVAEQSALFKNFGTGGGNADSAKAEVNAKAGELRKVQTNLSQEQAYTKIILDPANRDLAKRLRDEERSGV
jgi:hypothetical protein